MFFVKLKPAETYTHTHTHTGNLLKAIKQIGTICFAVFTFIFSSFADPDIASSASSADCKYAPLETYSGTSNLQADWEANTIQLHWYNGDTEITSGVPTSCTYDGSLIPPSTIPTRTGYTFKGWRVRQASNDCFASSVCGLTGSAVNGLEYDYENDDTAYGVYSHDGQWKQNESTYGLTAGGWAVKDTNGGVIKGIASCNSIISTNSAEWLTCNNDTFKPSNTFNSSSTGQYCWCKMTSYTPNNGSACNIASPSWVYAHGAGTASASGCAHSCATFCVDYVMDYADFRRALFGVGQ